MSMSQDEYQLQVMDDDGFGCAITGNPDTSEPAPRELAEVLAEYIGKHRKQAAELREGDRFRTHGTVVTVLHDAKHTTEVVQPLAGRPCVTVWGRREDTGAEGSMTFGPQAEVVPA